MTTRYSVRLEAPAAFATQHRAVLAALPEHFEIVESGAADAVLVADAATRRGARVLVAADTLTAPAIDTVAIPAMSFAPRLFAEPIVVGAHSTSFALYDSVVRLDRAGSQGIRTGLLEQLAALRALTGEALHLTKIVRIGEGYLADGVLGQRTAVVALTGVAFSSPGPAFALHAANIKQRLEIEIDEPSIARPARVQTFSAEGTTQGVLIHQNDHRLTWLAVHATLGGGRGNGYGQDAWRADIAEIMRVVS